MKIAIVSSSIISFYSSILILAIFLAIFVFQIIIIQSVADVCEELLNPTCPLLFFSQKFDVGVHHRAVSVIVDVLAVVLDFYF